jgi:hypothetical protein
MENDVSVLFLGHRYQNFSGNAQPNWQSGPIDTQQCYCQVICLTKTAQFLCQWNNTFLRFSLFIEDASKKVLQFSMPLDPIFNYNFCYNEQKCLL